MRMILVSALLALSVLAGIAAPASAFDAKSLYSQLERQSGGSSGHIRVDRAIRSLSSFSRSDKAAP